MISPNVSGDSLDSNKEKKFIANLETGLGGARRRTCNTTKKMLAVENTLHAQLAEKFRGKSFDDILQYAAQLEENSRREKHESKNLMNNMKCELDDAKRQSKLLKGMNFESKRRVEIKKSELNSIKKEKENLQNEVKSLLAKKDEEILKLKNENEKLSKEIQAEKAKASILHDLSEIRLSVIDSIKNKNEKLTEKVRSLEDKLEIIKTAAIKVKDVLLSKVRFWKISTKNRKSRASSITESIITDIIGSH